MRKIRCVNAMNEMKMNTRWNNEIMNDIKLCVSVGVCVCVLLAAC